jgi:hypothetical protein
LILGRNTPAAKVFVLKSEEDFHHTQVVSPRMKVAAVITLFLINGFFAYFTVLKGYVKGSAWQQAFLLAVIVQMVIEILLFETMECLWINFLMPKLVADEVQNVNHLLYGTISSICLTSSARQQFQLAAATQGDEKSSRFFLNAAEYLFISNRVAKNFPNLLESYLVLCYNSHIPGELSKRWTVGSNARIQHHRTTTNSSSEIHKWAAVILLMNLMK